MAAALECDVVVVGAGVAGLWAWRRLRARGGRAVLVSAGPIGAGQTLASQGIIHGGVKYALTGEASRASAMIAAMPGVWRACLEGMPGDGDPDLRAVRTLTDHQFLWTTGGIVSRLGGVAASRALRTGVERVREEDRPEAFRGAARGIDLYRVEEPVIEPASLVRALAGDGEGIVAARAGSVTLAREGEGVVVGFEGATGERAEIRAKCAVCAAGAGNEALMRGVRGLDGRGEVWTQRRPLHMVMVRGDAGAMPLVWGHCVTASALPRATVTSQRDAQGRTVWYVGGAIAESGVERTREAQIAHARQEMGDVIPWVDLAGAQWATLRVDRAEGLPEGRAPGARPDTPVVRRAGNVVFAWPTKLAFAPLLAEMVEREVGAMAGGPALGCDRGMIGDAIGALPWEEEGVQWS